MPLTIKRLQLALIHVAVAMTLVPINSTLNRVMIKEMDLSAALVSFLASLPYLFAPTQVLIGSTSDRRPLWGWRRSPYIALGLLLCASGVALAPQAVFYLPDRPALGWLFTFFTFAAWGMGYNIASVAYLSLASELTGDKGRSRTVAVMWFFMISGIILTAASLSRLLEDYSPARLKTAFELVALAALALGGLGLFGLEPRIRGAAPQPVEKRTGWRELLSGVLANPQARRFFFYLTLLLAAILGQDVLLEPFGAEAFALPVAVTTRITSLWGGCVLAALLLAGFLETRLNKRFIARLGAIAAIVGFILIAVSAYPPRLGLFYAGVVFLGVGTGLATVSNLSLMLDMTAARVGLFIGVWGVANALSRFTGTLMAGAVRDLIAQLSGSDLLGYIWVFVLQAVLLVASLVLLAYIDVGRFRARVVATSLSDRAVLMDEAG
jgi:BCD family chlorophyll transporter-like MFS transporter